MPKAKARTLDLSKAKNKGGRFAGKIKRYPEGDYTAVIHSVEDQESSEGNDMWVFAFKVKSGLFPYYCVLNADNLWKVRGLYEAAGLDVPSSKAKLDPNNLIGETVAVTLEDDEYEGRIKSKVVSVFSTDEVEQDADDADDEDEDEDDEPKKKSSKKGKKAKKARDEDEDEDEDEDDEDEDEEEERPKKKAKKKAKKSKRDDDDDEDEDLEDIDVEDV